MRAIATEMHFSMGRNRKERIVWNSFDRMEDKLFDAIQSVLSPFISENRRVRLYAKTLDGLEDFRDGEDLAISPRQFLRTLGQAGGVNLWVELFGKRTADADLVLVPDVRFDEEVAEMDELVNVIRPGVEAQPHFTEALAKSLMGGSDLVVQGKRTHHILNATDLAFLDKQAEAFATYLKERRQLTSK
jgi:hypothetical protein